MTYGNRFAFWAVLPMALAFAGCEGKRGLSGSHPDSGTPVPVNSNPDTAAPIHPNPDTAGPINPNPDSASPVQSNPDTAGSVRPPDARLIDTGIVRVDTRLPSPVDVGDAPSPVQPVANLVIDKSAVDFGTFDAGEMSAPITVTVTNVGAGTSGPLNVTVSGMGITASGCSGTSLAPGAACTITITVRAINPGAVSGTVEVSESAANSRKISVNAIATMVGQWLLSPSPLDLGSVVQGKTVSGTIVLTNSTGTGLAGMVITVSGTGFSRLISGTCTETLPVGQSCNINVAFTAGTTAGPAKGLVTVFQGGVSKIVPVTATVLGPTRLVMTPATASFQTEVGTPSSPVTFYVTNAADVDTTMPTVTITGTNKDDFSFESTCTKPLTGGATSTCQITVVYKPKTVPAASSAVLTVAESGTGGSSVTASLIGTAVGSTNPVNPVDLIPVDNTVSGWTVDPQSNVSGTRTPAVASTEDEGISYIDGGMEPFYADGFSPKQFVWQNYNNTHLPAAPVDSSNPQGASISLYVFRMPSAAQASGLYQNLLKYPLYTTGMIGTSNGWEEPTTPLVGAKSRIQNLGTEWWINFQKDEYYVEIRLSPSYGPAPDFAPGNLDLKKEALRFAQSVAGRL